MRIAPITTNLARGAALLLMFGAGPAHADNWMRSEDETYFKASLDYERADHRWNQHSDLTEMACTASNWRHHQSYEYGLSYYRTLFGALSYLDRDCGANDKSGLGDATIGIRSRLDLFRNGRTWEAAAIIPTGYSTSGSSSVGSGRYGLRLGVFGSFGERRLVRGVRSTNFELGSNLYFWEGSAPEQLSAYVKYNFGATAVSHFYGALEGDYALVDRSRELTSTVNPVHDYGYDSANARLGYTRRVGLDWHFSIEGSSVLWGRNVSDSSAIGLSFSRSFQD